MTILLTSFTTWLFHQKSNAADDLLEMLAQQNNKYLYHYLRKLPVETTAASEIAISKIQELKPSAVICCGMAESRYNLTIESNARCDLDRLQTSVDLATLVSQLSNTYISHDAGQFVCEGLYYQVLRYLRSNDLLIPCIFVHVPVLTSENTETILQDFMFIVQNMNSQILLQEF